LTDAESAIKQLIHKKSMNIKIYAGLEVYIVGKYIFRVLANILSLPKL